MFAKTTSCQLVVTVIVLALLATSSMVSAGKPEKNSPYPLLSAVFDDGPDDALQSDGNGAYENLDTHLQLDFFMRINTGDRTAFFDLSNCVTEPITTPFDPETSGDVQLGIMFWPAAVFFDEMVPGETYPVITEIYYKKTKKETWFFSNNQDPYLFATAAPFDNNNDDVVDGWVITVPEESVFSASIIPLGNQPSIPVAEYNIPFTVTVSLK
jgi:hypothetical protein